MTGSLPASPVLQGGVKGSYTKMFIFLNRAAKHCRKAEPPPFRAGRLHTVGS